MELVPVLRSNMRSLLKISILNSYRSRPCVTPSSFVPLTRRLRDTRRGRRPSAGARDTGGNDQSPGRGEKRPGRHSRARGRRMKWSSWRMPALHFSLERLMHWFITSEKHVRWKQRREGLGVHREGPRSGDDSPYRAGERSLFTLGQFAVISELQNMDTKFLGCFFCSNLQRDNEACVGV